MPAAKPPSKTKAGKAVAKVRKRKTMQGVSLYSPEMVEEICERVASGETLRQVCLDDNMPSWMTVHRWMRKYPEFAAEMRYVTQLQEEYLLDEVVEIAEGDEDTDIKRDKVKIDMHFKRIARLEKRREKFDQPKDPKVIEATPGPGGEWKVLENGERANPISDAISDFMRKTGMVKDEA